MLKHIGIIMDGNRRWAKERMLPAIAGHKAGADRAKGIISEAQDRGIQYITLWALSTENLVKRDSDEVKAIIGLIDNIEFLLGDAITNNIVFETIGDISKLPEKSQNILGKLKDSTKNNNGITVILALIYGGNDEIIRGIKKFISEGGDPESLTDENFRDYLDIGKYCKPDLIIRTGGDIRHSGFLLYDCPYSEYYFTDKKWPEFDAHELDKAIEFFNSSKRNFGK